MRAGDGFWRAMQGARRANLLDDGAHPPVPGSRAATRRTLLKGLAATGLAGAAGPLPALPQAAGRVAIIGGGLAGLSALHHLRRAGIDARLYEAGGRLGGRVHTIRREDGTAFERGGQLVNTDHADMHALARRFGIALVDRKAAPHRTVVVSDGAALADARLAAALRPIARRIDLDAQRLAADFTATARALDRLSMAAYLDAHAALIPAPWVRHLLEQTARTEYGVEPAQVSAIGLLFNLPVVDGERVEVLGGSDERYVLSGGSATLIDALAAAHADRIVTGREAIRIEADRRGAGVVFRDLSRVACDHVVLAVPARIARRIEITAPLPRRWRRFLDVMELGRNEKLQWAMAATPWRGAIGEGGELWSADRHAPAAQGWDATVRGGAERPVWNWFFGGAQAGQFASDRWLPAPPTLDALFAPALPPLSTARAQDFGFDRSDWGGDPLIGGAYVNYPPGMLTDFASLLWLEEADGRATQVARAGRIVFAGEHLSDAYPGYMNGAAQTGRLAAASLLGRRIAPDAA
ncbi:NAD(P)/FAD-dependent oxidoreductase [Sphingomonas sp. VNH70]|uniref:flavin monoamine oxidase family protein n=1 Tax=Sphingomonas silueang TaxID=3156617 RepID=UPI0032B50E83